MPSSTTPHCRELLLLLLVVVVTAVGPSQGFLGFGETSYWNLCAAELHCSCPEEALDAMTHGLECVGRSIASLQDNMVIPVRFRMVDLSRNKLLQVSRSTFASNNTQVTHLDLSANELQDVQPDTFANLPNLLSLNLKNNKISMMSNTSLSSLPNLTSLDLSYNHLKFLPVPLLWGSPQLESLSLAYNPIDQLQPGHFCRLSKLKRLDLTSLNLNTLHGDLFVNTTSLEELVLVHNNIVQVPTKALYRTGPSLRKLDLSGNYIETLVANSLYNLPHLEELRLEQMPMLRNIDAFAFYELTNLRTVVLRYLPKIRFIDEQAFSYTVNGSVVRSPVQDLTVSNTILQRMPENLLDWQALKYVNLHNNRWNCDCYFSWIKGSALDKLVGKQFYCSYPTRVRGTLLYMLTSEDFVCRPSDKMPDAWQWGTLTLLLMAGIAVSIATVSVLFYRRNGYLFRPPSTYDKLIAASRESMTVLDTTSIANTDAEINTATAT